MILVERRDAPRSKGDRDHGLNPLFCGRVEKSLHEVPRSGLAPKGGHLQHRLKQWMDSSTQQPLGRPHFL